MDASSRERYTLATTEMPQHICLASTLWATRRMPAVFDTPMLELMNTRAHRRAG